MKLSKLALPSFLLLGAVALVSCSDSAPVGPQQSPSTLASAQIVGTLSQTLNSLLACPALPAESVTQTVGVAGGVIRIGPHRLRIPQGALTRNVAITASIKSEHVNRVHFEPEGLTFAKPAELELSYAHCGKAIARLPKFVVYVTPGLNIIQRLSSRDDGMQKKVRAELSHFSDYAVQELSLADHAVYW